MAITGNRIDFDLNKKKTICSVMDFLLLLMIFNSPSSGKGVSLSYDYRMQSRMFSLHCVACFNILKISNGILKLYITLVCHLLRGNEVFRTVNELMYMYADYTSSLSVLAL